jgi:hypothetical protein
MDKDLLGSAKKNRIAAKRISVNKRRDEGAYLNWYVTEEQRGCRPIFIATLRAARLLAGCFVAHPTKRRSSAAIPATDLVPSLLAGAGIDTWNERWGEIILDKIRI